MNKPIGILDSGVGGLTIAKEIISLLPNESIVYIADSANTPYGAQHADEILDKSRKLVQFLLQHEVKLIVVACNTITVHCIDKLRKEFPHIPIVGTVPVVKKAVNETKNKKIGILSTSQTAKSSYQKRLIEEFANDCQVFVHGTDMLVPLIEQGIFEGEKIDAVLDHSLHAFKQEQIDTLVLGCTHYPLVSKRIQLYMGERVTLLDSSAPIARQVQRIILHNKIAGEGANPKYNFFTTADPTVLTKIVEQLPLEKDSLTIQQTTI